MILVIIVAIHQLRYTLITHWPGRLLVVCFVWALGSPNAAFELVVSMLKLLIVLLTSFLHVLHFGRAKVVQIHWTLVFLLFISKVHLHSVLVIQIVLGLRSPLNEILERMLTHAPHIMRIKVLGHTGKRLFGGFLLYGPLY